ncbi:MAG: nicotinate-nucleotide adenylyltransferase [Candidatus Sericytochromatia bacterium]|nr:nicotinate-nucleotide adenylyltransferase [Candidatus Sericytochromatia bacterium]
MPEVTQPRPWRVLYGGSFDPFHEGHRAVVEALLAWGADDVWIIPAARSPFKRQAPGASDADRLEMCREGTVGLKGVHVSDVDLARPAPSWAIDTVRLLQARHPGGTWWWALGSEHLPTLAGWRDIDELARRIRFAVVERPDLASSLSRNFAILPMDHIPMPPRAVSATAVRAALARGETPTDLAPGVQDRIRRKGLYRNAP